MIKLKIYSKQLPNQPPEIYYGNKEYKISLDYSNNYSNISKILEKKASQMLFRLNEGDELAASAKIILEDEELGEDGLPVEKEVAESSEQTPVNNLDDEESLNVGEGESKDSNDGDLSDSQEDDNKVDDEKLDDENNSENEDDSNEKLENDNLSEESVSGSEDDLADEPEDRKEE